jgi:hypothetical protein
VTGDRAVNVIDLQQVATSVMGGYIVHFDTTKDGQINVIDLQRIAAATGVCPSV